NITSFSFYYWAEFLGVNATMEVRFYKNDGAFGAPFSKIFDSTAFSINDTFGAGGLNTARSLVTFDTDFGAGLLAPGDFTWTIQFSNLGGGTAGVDLFSPPTVGNDYVDYWHNTGSTWEALTFGGSPNADFAASFDGEAAVPEPSGWVVNGLLGAGGVGAFLRLLWRRRRADSNSTAEA
ncbi:MAG: hypothetical protein NTW03_05275, partial [Verrucomicrobia bacterium]|nr:hypothetical protein [Verrucomicrobiota bacterium]